MMMDKTKYKYYDLLLLLVKLSYFNCYINYSTCSYRVLLNTCKHHTFQCSCFLLGKKDLKLILFFCNSLQYSFTKKLNSHMLSRCKQSHMCTQYFFVDKGQTLILYTHEEAHHHILKMCRFNLL